MTNELCIQIESTQNAQNGFFFSFLMSKAEQSRTEENGRTEQRKKYVLMATVCSNNL